jgi:hypothetical protein
VLFDSIRFDSILRCAGVYEIACRAFDESSNTQPSEVVQVWNKSGYMNNAWYRIRVIVTDKISAL